MSDTGEFAGEETVLYSCGESDCEVEVLNFSETSISLSHQLLPSVLTWQHGLHGLDTICACQMRPVPVHRNGVSPPLCCPMQLNKGNRFPHEPSHLCRRMMA
jgi:hypothetical protein